MITRSHSVLLTLSALLGVATAAPSARAADITRGGQQAELTVTSAGAHSVRVTLKPVGMELPPSPSLLKLEIKDPAIRLGKIEKPVKARVGALDVEITPAPLTVLVKSATGREIQSWCSTRRRDASRSTSATRRYWAWAKAASSREKAARRGSSSIGAAGWT
jgi:hypothetical protein